MTMTMSSLAWTSCVAALLFLAKPSASFSPLSLPPMPGACRTICNSKAYAPLSSFTSSVGKLQPTIVLRQSGGSASKAEQADLNFALWDAAKNGQTEEVERLVKVGANANYWDPEMLQATAVQWAANNGHAKTLAKLVELGASVHPTNQFGWTAMHHAANWGYLDCVQALIDLGADPMAASESGKTPAQCASFKGFENVVELIRSVAGDPTGLMEKEDVDIPGYAEPVFRGQQIDYSTWKEDWDSKGGKRR